MHAASLQDSVLCSIVSCTTNRHNEKFYVKNKVNFKTIEQDKTRVMCGFVSVSPGGPLGGHST